ncbi:MAG: DUF1223 domain-containing protein [Gammaproteobacteria bacterium]|nr:DUF1223 domain-containing protein [Gammaproteobacteria bacterium]
MHGWRSLLFIILYGGSVTAFAADWHVQSGPQRTVMIELYTSEGCNSCPPAERFLNSLADNPRLWQTYIPLAFHVDYWDYLGWRDRFARPAYSQRQRDYARVLRARTVYTPEFFVNGKEWRRSLFAGMPAIPADETGVLKLSLQHTQLSASFVSAQGNPGPLQLHVALLGMGLTSEIRAGENAGRHSEHEFVVLAHAQINSENAHWQTSLPNVTDIRPTRRALVAWVSAPGNPAPLQATGGLLP